ncbi:carbamoyl phosphate synthase-like protein [mine drainage metagenome]|uniref:Carbamoyl phosphate synthase-like protein n=1 Tax=mine drainage metagenome TaxID=410659 RepID=A0A1J5U098_9ZZZZ
MDAVNKLDASQYLGFVYGSGFEAQPELLQQVAELFPLIGNMPLVVRAVKTPLVFFDVLQRNNIQCPELFKQLHTNDGADVSAVIYLRKLVGGSGGTHIKIVDDEDVESSNCYYQPYIAGRSVSLLFVAHDNSVTVVGFNEQWVDAVASMPFRYGGAVSNIVLPQSIRRQLTEAAEKLTVVFGLIGLNSLDAIVQGDSAYILEVNPRLSATVDLYAIDSHEGTHGNLLNWHVNACLEDADFKYENRLVKRSKAHAIVYAPFDLQIADDFHWPEWVVDNPCNTMQVLAGEPVCTVIAIADSADEAKQLAHIRVKMLQLEITTN